MIGEAEKSGIFTESVHLWHYDITRSNIY